MSKLRAWLDRIFGLIGKGAITPTPEKAKGYVPDSDLIGRQGGQKRNRVHIYRQPWGYPIRLCDWVAVDYDSIDQLGICDEQDESTFKERLDAALGYLKSEASYTGKDISICNHCQAIVQGKRTAPVTFETSKTTMGVRAQ